VEVNQRKSRIFFTQISASGSKLYGLDEAGYIWERDEKCSTWLKLESPPKPHSQNYDKNFDSFGNNTPPSDRPRKYYGGIRNSL
jgi:hypothetical protein